MPKVNIVDEKKSTSASRSPPEKKPPKKKRKLKLDADKAKEYSKKLRFGKAEIFVDEASRMTKAQKREMYAATIAAATAHKKVDQYEKDNVGVEAAHEAEKGMEGMDRLSRSRYAHKLKKRAKLQQQKSGKAQTAQDARAGAVGSSDSAGASTIHTADASASNSISHRHQRAVNVHRARAAAAASASGKATGTTGAQKATSGVSSSVNSFVQKGKTMATSAVNNIVAAVRSNPHAVVMVGLIAVLILLVMSIFSGCTVMFSGTTQIFGQTTYSAEDKDIWGAEEDYKKLERELQREIDRIELTHPGYDEYQYDLDEIEHDPWELASYLSTLFDAYRRSEVQATLRATFEAQYELTTWTETQIRYRMEPVPIPVPPYVTMEPVPYTYTILHVKLVNRGLETVVQENLDEDQWKRYEIFKDTRGGRPYLFDDEFPSGGSSDGSGEPGINYQVPAEALTDPEFAAMLEEAEKYLGTPYVWGGSSPETGFDCSGYVCWVLNQSGWDVGRTTANGLWQQSTKISEAEAKPGDLVFFEGTYDTPGASHVGIYVGDGMMISAGDPIKYSNIHSSYWGPHLLGFGRIPK